MLHDGENSNASYGCAKGADHFDPSARPRRHRVARGAGGADATYIPGNAGSFGLGGGGGTVNVASGNGAGGGGGWYGGGGGANGFYCAGGGGGGSSYIGGVTSGTTIMFGQTGFVTNPNPLNHGYVIITELCSINIFASGSNSLNPAICSGQSLTLTTNAVSNFSWSTGQTTSSIVVAPGTNTVYSLVATSSLNCSSSATRSVSVNNTVPVLSISNPSNNICLGRTATLTASGALSYTWANAGVVNGQTFTPQSTTNYTVFGTNGCGTSSAVTTITVAPLPVLATTSSSLVCEGSTATLTAVSAVNGYTWQPGAQAAATAIVAPTIATVYTVTASDGICSGTQTVLVTTKTTPTISVTPNFVPSLCQGDAVTLTATGAGTGGSYSWTPGNGTTAAIAVSPATSTLYVVSGTNSLNCTATAQVPVVVAQPLPLNVTANATLVCSGATVNLSANGSTTYSWTNGPATAAYQVNPTAALTIYTVTGFNTANPCTATRTIAIAAITPSVNVTTPVSMCAGGSATVTATGATTYTWNGTPMGANNVFVASPAQTSTYVLIANTNSITTNCSTTRSVEVIVNPNPTITITLGKTTICRGETHTLTATGAASFVWQGTLGINNVITVKPTTTTIYTLVGTTAAGCSSNAQISAAVSACNGIEDLDASAKITVYPNPNNGQFYIRSVTPVTLRLSNTLGQHLQTLTLNSENGFKVEVRDLAKGVYFLSTGDDSTHRYFTRLVVD